MPDQSRPLSKYSPDAVGKLEAELDRLTGTVQSLRHCIMKHAATAPNSAAVHLNEGVSRRLMVLHDAACAVFQLIPPSNTCSSRATIRNATLALHAFLINAVGIMDNMAWSYLYWHGIDSEFRQLEVDLFKRKLQQRIPEAWERHLTSPGMVDWQNSYLKPYRDALAHRIPPYIPETFSPQETAELQRIDAAVEAAMRTDHWAKAEQLLDQKEAMLGHAYTFVHSLTPPIRPLILHPQLMADFATIEAVMRVFLRVLPDPPRSAPKT